MHSSQHTIAILTAAGQWEWTLFDRKLGLVASGVARNHEEAMSRGWSAAREITPASANVYPEIVLLHPMTRGGQRPDGSNGAPVVARLAASGGDGMPPTAG